MTVYREYRANSSPKTDSLMLLPCAGFGKRVGSPEAKEMLPRPATGRPLIEHSLALALELGCDVHLIARAEKTSLIGFVREYSRANGLRAEIQLVNPTPDWPETLLLSQSHWRQRNLVVLPDSDWEPTAAASDVLDLLERTDAAYAVFQPPQSTGWGWVKTSSEHLSICEKPRQELEGFSAWGLMGFRRECGGEILAAHQASTADHLVKTLKVSAKLIPLVRFTDLTR